MNEPELLHTIQSPKDLAKLSAEQPERLAEELRQRIITTVRHTGGHLASNLGAVELTLAAHLALNLPHDKLIFDVGHQCYTHKLLTGRQEGFAKLRGDGGISGFPKMSESEYDCFGTGHASTSISAAVGFAKARDMTGGKYKVAAIIGDGALTGGLSYEALNDAGRMKSQLLVILNDNQMSIDRNVGGLDKHLTRLRASRRWHSAKRRVKGGLDRIPVVGSHLADFLELIKRKVRQFIVNGSFFESLGFRYLGPIDGHDLPNLTRVMRGALTSQYPTVLHVLTRKGKGDPDAEREPEKYHGVSLHPAKSDESPASEPKNDSRGGSVCGSAEQEFDCADCKRYVGEALVKLADKHKNVAAITAAMPIGTGLSVFREKYPERFFDAGIAEAHAVTMAAGMAAAGVRPYVAVYSTFFQRAVDFVIHDVALQKLPVTFLLDHAGFVEHDGATHQGIFDIALLQSIPELIILAPSDISELTRVIEESHNINAPVVIRYPKALPMKLDDDSADPFAWKTLREGGNLCVISHGAAMVNALIAARILDARGIQAEVVRASSIKPIDADAVNRIIKSKKSVYIVEETPRLAGLSAILAHEFAARGAGAPTTLGAIDGFPEQYTRRAFEEAAGLTPEAIAEAVEHGAR
ncbi:MAG: 1-deoxy-D-xylulose-5-phosphate synthase [Oscillospiraceae bacterium]|jgi:1-deoxy-D-xylulose-5-phosphate synthase|nr:1-deoxy-D-xylulose-5-phosphate synthase [Oscillospiraceae bacterium]